ncbi:MAG: hypothetical protein LIR50_19740 [Bacillota bacterium]|nr:hypothetical protein [Bacillota bacterium]
MIQINKKSNRIKLSLKAIEMGKDLCIILTGGEAHLGSVTVGNSKIASETFSFKNHKEYIITEMSAEILKREYSGNFVISCGIHLDNIRKEEISDISNMCCEMIKELCLKINS